MLLNQRQKNAARCLLAIGLVLVSAWVGATQVFSGVVTHIPDGDTLWVQPDGGGVPRKLRLQGIDAPEICQAGGAASRDALTNLIGHQHVRVTVKYFDIYGRGLAHIDYAGQDVAQRMVLEGQAWSSRWRKSLGPYATQEAQARQAQKGLFGQAAPELPRSFRKRHGSCYPDFKKP
jgi:endonuclease YncB( thermonuclease family)